MEISENMKAKIEKVWPKSEKVLEICLEELDEQITFEGMFGEICSDISRFGHVELAGKIGILIGQSETPFILVSRLLQEIHF